MYLIFVCEVLKWNCCTLFCSIISVRCRVDFTFVWNNRKKYRACWIGSNFKTSQQVDCFVPCRHFMKFPLVLHPQPFTTFLNWGHRSLTAVGHRVICIFLVIVWNPYKHRFIAGSSKCSTKPLSILLTKLLTHIKQGLQKYCETSYSRRGVNQMWILKNSKELLEHLQSPNFNHITSIKSFEFSTLYTTIPHQKLKSRLATIIRNSFIHKNGNRRYKFLVLGREGPYFVKEHSDSKNKYTEDDIINMLEFLVDNIFVVFGGKVFQQIVGIPMGTNCAPLLADIFLYSYEAEFIHSLLSTGKKKISISVQLHIQMHRWRIFNQ